jgi:hypothetical protein
VSKINKKIIQKIITIILFIIISVGMFYYQMTDKNVEKSLEINPQEKTSLTFETDIYFANIHMVAMEQMTGLQMHVLLLDERGYYLYESALQINDETDFDFNVRKKLHAGEKYDVQIILTDSNGKTIQDAPYLLDIKLQLYGYAHLPLFISIFAEIVLLCCLFLVLAYIDEAKFIKAAENKISCWGLHCSQPSKGEYIILFLIFAGIAVSFMYGDTKAFVYYIFDFWDSIFGGGGLKYFREYSYQMFLQYRANGINEAYAANYNFSIHFLLGILGFPLWLIAKCSSTVGTVNLWMLIYVKLLFVVSLSITAYLIYKICLNIFVDKMNAKWASFLFLSSALVFAEIGLIGQLDVIGIPFTLFGIYYFQKNDTWRFLLFFAIAVTFKQFPFFIFVPLLLLKEKNVIKIAIETAFVFGFSILTESFLVKDTVATQYKADFSSNSLSVLLGVKFPLYNNTIPILILMLGVICVYCYMIKLENQKQINEYSIFISSLAITSVMISFDGTPYWYMILAPFFSILMIYNSKQFKSMILFETVGMAALILNQYGANYWCFEPTFGEGALLDKIFGYPTDFITMKTLSAYLRLDIYSGVMFAVFIVCAGAIIFISRPGKIEQSNSIVVRPYAWTRLLINAGIAYIPIALYLISIVLYK